MSNDMGFDHGFNFSKQFNLDGAFNEKEQDPPEEKDKTTQSKQTTKQGNAAGIISASAEGLDSITSMIAMFTGKDADFQGKSTSNNATDDTPPRQKKPSPVFIVTIVVAVFVFIGLLLYFKSKNKA